MTLSDRIRHLFHVVSNVRPIVWIGLYVALMPLFAWFYWLMPAGEFRIPDGGGTDYGSWLYYSIVTLTTLGFGDYTPAHAWAQAVTAIEVMCGVVTIGFFLNAVGSMKSEIDVASEIEKQRRMHRAAEHDKLMQSIPMVIHDVNRFLAFCYALTTPQTMRRQKHEFDDNFRFADLAGLYQPSGLPTDHTGQPVVEGFIKSARALSLMLDSMQNRIDLTIWPNLMEDSFSFVADYQMFSSTDALATRLTHLLEGGRDMTVGQAEHLIEQRVASAEKTPDPSQRDMAPLVELYVYVRRAGLLARKLEVTITAVSSKTDDQ